MAITTNNYSNTQCSGRLFHPKSQMHVLLIIEVIILFGNVASGKRSITIIALIQTLIQKINESNDYMHAYEPINNTFIPYNNREQQFNFKKWLWLSLPGRELNVRMSS